MARTTALDVLIKYQNEHSYLNITLNDYLEKSLLSRNDKDLATRIVYGTIQNKLYLEYQLAPYIQGKKIKNRERNILKRFFVNEKEDERIKLMMRKTGITNFSIFARRAYCNKEIFSIDFSEYKNIISEISSTKSELKRIGNNINQIAKHLNENKNNQTKELMSDYQKQLENLEDKIQKVVHYISEG